MCLSASVGDEIPTPRFPCEFCECTGPNEVACSVVDCAAPPCTNPIQKPDTCCPICEIGNIFFKFFVNLHFNVISSLKDKGHLKSVHECGNS